jgi:hypothetical protein
MTKTKLTLKNPLTNKKLKSARKIQPLDRYCWKCEVNKNFNFYKRQGRREIYLCETCSNGYEVVVG